MKHRIQVSRTDRNASLPRALGAASLCLLASVALTACSDGGKKKSGLAPVTQTAEVEPNDLLGSAFALGNISRSSNLVATGDIDGLGADQYDAYQLTITENASLKLAVEPSASNSDVDLWVASADGTVQMRFESGTAGATEQGTYAATKGETLYVVVLAFDADTSYELSVAGS